MVEEFCRHRKEYGYIMRMGSHVFFNGLALGETNKINIEDGKTLVIKYLGLGDLNEDGTRNVQFELNGMRREVAVPDKHAVSQVRPVSMADPEDKSQIGASIPGMVSKVSVKPGDAVEENQVVAVIEAMKMETSVVARKAGTVDQVLIQEGSSVKAGELLMTIKLKSIDLSISGAWPKGHAPCGSDVLLQRDRDGLLQRIAPGEVQVDLHSVRAVLQIPDLRKIALRAGCPGPDLPSAPAAVAPGGLLCAADVLPAHLLGHLVQDDVCLAALRWIGGQEGHLGLLCADPAGVYTHPFGSMPSTVPVSRSTVTRSRPWSSHSSRVM